eukprot:2494041-Pyramimonas_sp.AAC.1
MSKVVLSEQQHMILDADRAATMRVSVTAAAKRAGIVKGDDLLAKADIQANTEKVPKALYTELKTRFDNKSFKLQDASKASNITTSRHAYTWKFMKNEKGEMERTIR